MNSLQFRKDFHNNFEKVLHSPMGRAALVALMSDRPPPNAEIRDKQGSGDPILTAKTLGKIEGYEEALRNLRLLAFPPPDPIDPKSLPKQDYGQKAPDPNEQPPAPIKRLDETPQPAPPEEENTP